MKEIIIHNRLEQDHVPLYNSKGKLVGIIKNMLAFNDVIIQIREKNLKGYYIIYNGLKYQIKDSGDISHFPKDLYKIYEDQMIKLLGF